MNETIKLKIVDLRNQGLGYKKISMQLGINVNSVKSYCRQNHLTSKDLVFVKCKQCNKLLSQKEKTKKRQFCCDECRKKWWNSNKLLLKSHKKEM